MREPRCTSTDRDGVMISYAAVAASILIWSWSAAPRAVAQIATQDTSFLSGNWAGALDVQGVQLRLVLHVKHESGRTTATLDSLDQQSLGIPVSAIVRTADQMSFDVDVVGGRFVGTLSSDSRGVAGTWSQGGNSLPLALKR